VGGELLPHLDRQFLGLLNEEASTSETTKLVNVLKGFKNINEENFDE
jgi:hypothetical protein